ncbi:lecithin retinol acyltransferase family protein [bacterium]|nr:lecithin retinol acyltransferase family protein [bacterium]
MNDLILSSENEKSVKRVVRDSEIKFGDVVGVHRMQGIYDHYGIYTGNGGMIHYADPSGDFGTNIVVHRTTLEKFKEGSEYLFVIDFDMFVKENTVKLFDILKPGYVDFVNLYKLFFGNNNYHIYSPEETVKNAESRLGERKYNLATNNCEHFAIWCKTGVSESTQVENLLKLLSAIRINRR